MTLSTSASYAPVLRSESLERLAIFSPDQDATGDQWTEVHDEIQRQLAQLESDVRQKVPGILVHFGHTKGERFLLFSYRTFSLPESGLDPVVAGITFTPAQDGVTIEADISGEHIGDLILSLPRTTVADAREALMMKARALAWELSRSGDQVVAALRNTARKVE